MKQKDICGLKVLSDEATRGETINLEDLAEGKIFDGDELILWADSSSMTTLRHEGGFEIGEGGYREYEMRLYHYDLILDGNQIRVINNGYGEIFEDDKNYTDFKRKLEDVELWREIL